MLVTSEFGQYDEGTDSKIYAKLIGTNGKESSEKWLKLKDEQDFFLEPGSKVIIEPTFEDVGDIAKLVIRQDGSGIAPHWHLNKVIL